MDGRLLALTALLALGLACGDDADDGVPFDAAPADGSMDAGADAGADGGSDLGTDGAVDLGTDAGPPPPATCAGFCGRASTGGCRCDDSCAGAGACCDDYETTCAVEAEVRAELTAGHMTRGYDGGRDLMYGISGSVDVVDGELECVYTGTTVAPDGTRTPGGIFNTEHVWPRSAGEPSGSAGDLYNLRPTLEEANGERGNFPFGETTCSGAACDYARGGSELGVDTAGATVWQVRAERQGDIARSIFYFATRYRMDLPAAEEAALRAWHAADPPDDVERGRVDRVEAAQGNRNVFVDRPELVDAIPDF
ncbi:MAG: hypothetical protein CMN30_24090 [Sandaracinus sp.]|nr:hypothetical protein [Sandaracinus sp.]